MVGGVLRMLNECDQVLLNTTEVTRQQCSVSFGWQPTNDLTSPHADLWEEVGMSGRAAQSSASEVYTDGGKASPHKQQQQQRKHLK